MNYNTCIYSVLRMKTCWKIITLLHCMYLFLLIASFMLHNYIEFNASHSQQTTSIFLIGIGIQDLIFDRRLVQTELLHWIMYYLHIIPSWTFPSNKQSNRIDIKSLMFTKFQRFKFKMACLLTEKHNCST